MPYHIVYDQVLRPETIDGKLIRFGVDFSTGDIILFIGDVEVATFDEREFDRMMSLMEKAHQMSLEVEF